MPRIIRREPKSSTEQIVEHANAEAPVESDGNFIPTGLGLWNLGLSNDVSKGFKTGKIANIIGDKSSGKSFLCLSLLAEAANDPAFDRYKLIYDDAEAASEFNLVKLFGARAAERILPPNENHEDPNASALVIDFQCNVNRLLEAGEPFIYVLDSLDAINAKQELEHAKDLEKAHLAGKEAKGSYGMEKPKQMSILLRQLVAGIKHTRSMVIIISQTRDNIDPMSFAPKTRAGGKALEFYCSYEMWLAVVQKFSEKVGEKRYGTGILSRIKITKNKVTGMQGREIDIPIYYSYGADDIGSCVDFLVQVGAWKKGGQGVIDAAPLRLSGTRTKLLKEIEAGELVDRLHVETHKAWRKIEASLVLNRKPRYG